MPGARERWLSGGETWPFSGARKATKALLTDSVMIASMVIRCAGLKDCCAGVTGSSGSSCPNISSIEQDEALSDRALSPCSGRVQESLRSVLDGREFAWRSGDLQQGEALFAGEIFLSFPALLDFKYGQSWWSPTGLS